MDGKIDIPPNKIAILQCNCEPALFFLWSTIILLIWYATKIEIIISPAANKVIIKIKKISKSELKNNWIGNKYNDKVKIKDTMTNIIKNILNLESAEYVLW